MVTSAGVFRVTWWDGVGQPDAFVVAYAARASFSWLRLADVVVLPPQPTVALAEETTATALAQLSGCSLVAANAVEQHHVLLWRDGRRLVTTSAVDVLWCCVAEYASQVSGSRAIRSASRSAFGSSCSANTARARR
ncbi:hypothetical protein BCF44_118147 [Kutzneria buriramensis]|uniref:Uncharacterized protein n=1 Tax=Kutzneria buriramensis TaxID=1045776 RepID=A0A3E0GZJ7_9PSEU|nr:hypothetical protein BCF44_118147 [Kutzneria buriramensis]